MIEALSALQGGGQTYLRNLLANYCGEPGDRLIVIVPEALACLASVERGIETYSPSKGYKSVLARVLWLGWKFPKFLEKVSADLLYCPGGMLSARPRGTRTVVAFRNMLPFSQCERERFPLGYVRFRLGLLKWLQSNSFRTADLVIFVSHYAKEVIDRAVSGRKGQSIVISHGIGDAFRIPAARPDRPWLPENYVLYVSILDVYKAQVEVVDAWHLFRHRYGTDQKLVLVGPDSGPYAERVRQTIARRGLEGEVIVAGNVPHEDLPGLLQHATVNLFASSCENCPNILLEALAAGRPVLCSNYSPMPEFGGDAVCYFDPYRPEELAARLAELLGDSKLRDLMGLKAAAHSEAFDWKYSAQHTWRALMALARLSDRN